MLFQMCTKYDIYFKAILDSSSIQKQFNFKPIQDISYSSNKISKKYIYLFLATIINTLKKTKKQFKSKTPPQVNKKGKRLFTEFNNRLT